MGNKISNIDCKLISPLLCFGPSVLIIRMSFVTKLLKGVSELENSMACNIV